MLIWAAPRVARHVGANGAAALWICVLNPLVIIHLMGGVHNEMLMVGLMMAGIALTFARPPDRGASRLIAIAVAVKATAGLALPFMVWVWMRQLRDSRGLLAAAGVRDGDRGIDGDLRRRCSPCCRGWPGVGLGWLTALAGFGEDHQLADGAHRRGEPGQRRRRPVLPGQLLRRARRHPDHRHRDHRDLTSVAVVAVSARRPRGADGHRAGRCSSWCCSCPPRCPGTTPGRWRCCRRWRRADRPSPSIAGLLDLDHGDLQTRWHHTACTRGCTCCWPRRALRRRGTRSYKAPSRPTRPTAR